MTSTQEYKVGDKVRTVCEIPQSTPQVKTGLIGGFGPSEAFFKSIPKGTIGTIVEVDSLLLVSFEEDGVTGRNIDRRMIEWI